MIDVSKKMRCREFEDLRPSSPSSEGGCEVVVFLQSLIYSLTIPLPYIKPEIFEMIPGGASWNTAVSILKAQKETSMVTFESLTPNIMVKDVNQTLEYYKNILGFEIVDTNPVKGQMEWGFVKKGKAGLMFQELSSLRTEYPSLSSTPLGGAMTFYVLVQEDIESWFMELEGKVKVIKELNTTFYGTKEFAIEDINGFILTFSERKGAE